MTELYEYLAARISILCVSETFVVSLIFACVRLTLAFLKSIFTFDEAPEIFLTDRDGIQEDEYIVYSLSTELYTVRGFSCTSNCIILDSVATFLAVLTSALKQQSKLNRTNVNGFFRGVE